MALVTQAEFARHRKVSRVAVYKRTVTAGGPIPVHGPKKLIDLDEADRLWDATKSAAGASHGEPGATPIRGTQMAQARAAALVLDVQTKRLVLEQRRRALISRDLATHKAFAFARMLRESCLTWPARIGPQLAAAFDLDAATVMVHLDEHVRALLIELASQRVEF